MFKVKNLRHSQLDGESTRKYIIKQIVKRTTT
jgi:hypothetical protein